MNFFIWRKQNVSFSRYLCFCVFVKPNDIKICDVIIGMLHNGSYTLAYFFWILSTIKMKLGQIKVCRMKNFSNMFLAQCWRLNTSCRLFYNFIKMILYYSDIWPFLIVDIHHFQMSLIHLFKIMKTEKDMVLSPSPRNCLNNSWKLLPLFTSISWPCLVT